MKFRFSFLLVCAVLFSCDNREEQERHVQQLIHEADSIQAVKDRERFATDSARNADSFAFGSPTWEEDSLYWINLWENQNQLLEKADSAHNP